MASWNRSRLVSETRFLGDDDARQIVHLCRAQKALPIEKEIGYAQAVRIGNMLYISGSVGAGEMPAAIRESYDKLNKTLAAHELDFRNVMKENVFTTDLDAFKASKEIRKEYYGTECPAATWVQVQRLYLPKFVVEVELAAVFPKS